MSLIVAEDRRFAIVLALTVFFTIWTKLFNLKFFFYRSAKIKDFRFFKSTLAL